MESRFHHFLAVLIIMVIAAYIFMITFFKVEKELRDTISGIVNSFNNILLILIGYFFGASRKQAAPPNAPNLPNEPNKPNEPNLPNEPNPVP